MRSIIAAVLGCGLVCYNLAAADSTKDNAKPAPEAEAAWAEIVKESRPPTPPAEWGNTKPTPEQASEWNKRLAELAESVANKSQKFYETYPNHPKAEEARSREKSFRRQAAGFRGVGEPKNSTNTAETSKTASPQDSKQNPEFAKRMDELMARARERRDKEGPAGVLEEFAKSGRALAEEFPDEIEPWKLLMTAAMNSPAPQSTEIYKFIGEKGPAQFKEMVEPEIKRAESVGKPLALAFKDTNGKDLNITQYKDKVVLIDFWATWCGPCIASLPELKRVYQTYHEKGLEIVGISFDEDCDEMKRFIRKEQMPWPQFCDGGGWKNALNKEFNIRGIPTMYLVDKKGVLRDINARQDMSQKIEALLKE